MDQKTLISGLGLLILGFFVCTGSFILGIGRLSKPGPGFISFLGGSVIVFLSSIDVIKGLASQMPRESVLEVWKGVRWGKTALLFIVTLIYTLVIDILGFLLATFLFLTFCMKLLETRRWVIILITSILLTLAFYLLSFYFEMPISPLPKG